MLHGGPGGAGQLQSLAADLGQFTAVLEPHQSAKTISGQILELHNQLSEIGDGPFLLIGHSWGGWLGFLFASQYPDLVSKLILIGAPPFEDRFKIDIEVRRKGKLTEEEEETWEKIKKTDSWEELNYLIVKRDSYQVMKESIPLVKPQWDIFKSVWPEADKLRKSGELLKKGSLIACPVVAIHGVDDPHPFEGVEEPLARIYNDFKMILLERCGHYPWLEYFSRVRFMEVLKEEIFQVN